MREAIQMWSPDTCECAFHQKVVYDDDGRCLSIDYVTREDAEAVVENLRRTRPKGSITDRPQPEAALCQHHAAHGHTPQRHAVVLDENRRKNIAFAIAQAHDPSISYEDYQWSFDADRKLVVSFKGGKGAARKPAMQAAADLQFGPNRIVVA